MRRHALISSLLVASVLASFSPALRGQFVSYDDDQYVTDNEHVKQGLTAESVAWAWTTGHAANWHPLTWLSLMLDYQIYGLRPFGFHLTNVLLHAANAVLLYLLLWRMTRQIWQSALVAAIFAVHPLRVESVAWVSERKDVLCALFGLLALAAYTRYAAAPSVRRYALVVVPYVLSLLAKPMLVTLPMLLLLLDYWPLRRFLFSPAITAAEGLSITGKAAPTFRQAATTWLVLEKLSLLLIAIGSSAITFAVQLKGEAVRDFEAFTLDQRLANAVISCVRYLIKMVRLDQLAVFYPHPAHWPTWQVAGAGSFLAAVTLLVLLRAKRSPWLTVGWLWYLVALVPVIGIVQVGDQALADRYTYLPTIGIIWMIVWSLPSWLWRSATGRVVLGVGAAAVLLVLGAFTWVQARYWQNTETLFERAASVSPDNYMAYASLGFEQQTKGNMNAALEYYRKAVDAKPTWAPAFVFRGVALREQGHSADAIGEFSKAIELNPKFAEAYHNRAAVYERLGNNRRAVQDYTKALEIKPTLAAAYQNRGRLYFTLGQSAKAVQDYSKAIELQPREAQAYDGRGLAYNALRQFDRAVDDLTMALRLRPGHTSAYLNRGIAFLSSGRPDDAIADFARVIKLEPNHAPGYYNRGMARMTVNQFPEAIDDFDEAIRRQPDFAEAYANRGWSKERMGRHERAMADYERAIELKPDFATTYYYRATAYTSDGQYDLAWRDVEACERLGGQVNPQFLDELRKASGKSP